MNRAFVIIGVCVVLISACGETDYSLRCSSNPTFEDCERALEIDSKDAVAWFKLGGLYEEKTRGSEAVRAYETAADLNFIPALQRLGELFESGHGVEKNNELALVYYGRILDLGNQFTPTVVLNRVLALMPDAYLNGDGGTYSTCPLNKRIAVWAVKIDLGAQNKLTYAVSTGGDEHELILEDDQLLVCRVSLSDEMLIKEKECAERVLERINKQLVIYPELRALNSPLDKWYYLNRYVNEVFELKKGRANLHQISAKLRINRLKGSIEVLSYRPSVSLDGNTEIAPTDAQKQYLDMVLLANSAKACELDKMDDSAFLQEMERR